MVVLAVNGFRDVERAKEMLYVGLSRTRNLPVLVGQKELLVQSAGEAWPLSRRCAAARSPRARAG